MIIDTHVHCGIQDLRPPQDYETIAELHRECGVEATAMFAPVMEVYDRHNPRFEDDPGWRQRRERANRYLLELGQRDLTPKVYPFLFVWNDFRVDELDRGYVAIKWHRHSNEPRYDYDDPACRVIVDAICERNMGILLEEEFQNTGRFVNELAPECRILIPHFGNLNGGYEAIADAGWWERPNVFTDCSGGCSTGMMQRYVDDYGAERLLFGSDYPFSTPASSRQRFEDVRLGEADRKLVYENNFFKFVGRS